MILCHDLAYRDGATGIPSRDRWVFSGGLGGSQKRPCSVVFSRSQVLRPPSWLLT